MKFDGTYKMLINGELVDGAGTIDVFNPATGEAFAQAPDCSKAQLDDAVAGARAAFPAWRALSYDDRAAKLNEMADALDGAAEDMARLFTQEQGRPVDQALTEIQGGAAWLRMISAQRIETEIKEDSDRQYVETRHVPLGVVCAIAPWNFPISLSIWKIAPALLTGNVMVLKPSPFTPLCTLKMAELFKDILPAGVLNIISGGDNLGPMMTEHPGFDKVSFTGSSETGKAVMGSAAKSLKQITLELGGNDAAIVMPDVDVDAVAAQIFNGAFFNTSQICIATKRLYIHEDVYEPLKAKLLEIAQATKVGDGADQGTGLGPIQNQKQYERVLDLLEDAKANDLTILQGADVPDNGGYFVPVTMVDNPPEDSRVVQEEAFGPILPLLKFDDVDDVINRANDSDYGLAGAVWTKDIDAGIDIARRMETGTIWVNQNLALRPDTPFGGHKQSGFGSEHGEEGLKSYTVPQVISVAR